jgi:hypothetical protein
VGELLMMREEIRDALESARSATGPRFRGAHAAEPQRRVSFDTVRNIVLQVVRELPEDTTISDLRDELEGANNQ